MGQNHTFSSKRQSSYPSAAPRFAGDLELGAVFILFPHKFCQKWPECRLGKTSSRILTFYRTFEQAKPISIFLFKAKQSDRFGALDLGLLRDDFRASNNSSTDQPL